MVWATRQHEYAARRYDCRALGIGQDQAVGILGQRDPDFVSGGDSGCRDPDI